MDYFQMESYLKAIGDSNRMRILKYLMKDSLCICEFTELMKMTQPAISQHMKKLKQAELVLEEKRGRWTIWSLNIRHAQYPILIHLLSLLPEPERTIETLKAEGKKVVCE
ncbi:metalloregulator ArsR/SmtB family transcription factor [Planococcus sp. 107-1]|uniref:ArsR/SmtB family transcription factor n=1 Tax=Planococcus sp. 107-1 TaxID=2908840 RepID=UPI001F188B90|nr:metalloregulator ArsR/SmtB family transcription factor [Planococcus sp. 107-1]UJF27381.1 metalloregulator ArsR/SmtB family transcription factor [Planococcus sp. 107-1]